MPRSLDRVTHYRHAHDAREAARREARAAKSQPDQEPDEAPLDPAPEVTAEVVPVRVLPEADPNTYCTSPDSHRPFWRRLQGRVWTCTIDGPCPGDS
jgi:hypothetical protein